eukprot:1385005-Amorphochlora_amoeboformis.AAC.1
MKNIPVHSASSTQSMSTLITRTYSSHRPRITVSLSGMLQSDRHPRIPGIIGYYRVLLGIRCIWLQLVPCTREYRILSDITGYYSLHLPTVCSRHPRIPDTIGYYRVLPGIRCICAPVVPGTREYRVFLGITGCYRVFAAFGSSCPLLD